MDRYSEWQERAGGLMRVRLDHELSDEVGRDAYEAEYYAREAGGWTSYGAASSSWTSHERGEVQRIRRALEVP